MEESFTRFIILLLKNEIKLQILKKSVHFIHHVTNKFVGKSEFLIQSDH